MSGKCSRTNYLKLLADPVKIGAGLIIICGYGLFAGIMPNLALSLFGPPVYILIVCVAYPLFDVDATGHLLKRIDQLRQMLHHE